jgi:hypothetical protein
MQPEEEVRKVLDQLAILEPTSADSSRPAASALARLNQKVEARHRGGLIARLSRVLTIPRGRLVPAAMLFVVLFAIGLSFPSVRAAASEFLGLFRVRKFAAISISPEQIALLERIAEEGLMPGELEIRSESADLTPVPSLSDASAVIGRPVQSLADLGEPDDIYLTGRSTGYLIIDLEGSRAILEAAGVDPLLLPDSLDGERVQLTVYPGVEQHWQDGSWFLQAESPLVQYPDALDPTVLGQALLQVLGMSYDESVRLAQNIDWTSTLLLPIPQEFATFSEVAVNGVSGLALASLDGEHGAIMWQMEGIIYLLNGTGSTSELVSIADSLQ